MAKRTERLGKPRRRDHKVMRALRRAKVSASKKLRRASVSASKWLWRQYQVNRSYKVFKKRENQRSSMLIEQSKGGIDLEHQSRVSATGKRRMSKRLRRSQANPRSTKMWIGRGSQKFLPKMKVKRMGAGAKAKAKAKAKVLEQCEERIRKECRRLKDLTNSVQIFELLGNGILAVLPSHKLVPLRSVCWNWNNIITSPYFTWVQAEKTTKGLISCRGIQPKFVSRNRKYSKSESCTLPVNCPAEGVPMITILGSSDGIVLSMVSDDNGFRLMLGNIITGSWLLLTPIPVTLDAWSCFGLSVTLVNTGPWNADPRYQVVILSVKENWCYFYVLTSETKVWKKASNKVRLQSTIHPVPVWAEGRFYWMTDDVWMTADATKPRCIWFNPGTKECGDVMLPGEMPSRPGHNQIAEVNGCLGYIKFVGEWSTFNIYRLQGGEWSLFRTLFSTIDEISRILGLTCWTDLDYLELSIVALLDGNLFLGVVDTSHCFDAELNCYVCSFTGVDFSNPHSWYPHKNTLISFPQNGEPPKGVYLAQEAEEA